MILQELLELIKEEEPTSGSAMNLSKKGITSLKDQNIPDIVEGRFQCQLNKLTSLEYGPTKVIGDFYCFYNQLTSLRYGPTEVIGHFSCAENRLTDLKYAPTKVTGAYECIGNQLTSLQCVPTEIKGNFNCADNQLTSLEHGPTAVTGSFFCQKNQLTSLEHCSTKVTGDFHCDYNQLTSLQGIHKLFKGGYIKGKFDFSNNPVESHILGLLLIPELTTVNYKKGNSDCITAVKIINKHLAGKRNVIDCQRELIQAGLKEFAKL